LAYLYGGLVGIFDYFVSMIKPKAMKNFSIIQGELILSLILLLCFLNPNISRSQALPPPYNLTVVFTNDIIPIIELNWEYSSGSFLYFLVERDGDSIGTSNIPYYTETVPCFCTYCYNVYAVYNNGISEPAGPACTFDSLASLIISPDQLEQWMFPNEVSYIILNIDNTGDTAIQYTFPAFVSGTPPPGFISNINLPSLVLPPGVGADVAVTFDANGYNPGTAYQELIIETTDPFLPVDTIPCYMHVYSPAYLSGIVTDSVNSQPLEDVSITAGFWNTSTLINGSYYLVVPADSYNIVYEKDGYHAAYYSGNLYSMQSYEINKELKPLHDPVPWVLAESVCNEPAPAEISWGIPAAPFEIYYDDGSAEDLFVWASAGGENAVKFTLVGYPTIITGGRVFVGDGTFPVGNWINSEFSILVYNEDINGLPDNCLDSISVVVENYEWIEFQGLNAQIDSGDFFISMMQMANSPDAAPIAIDEEMPIVDKSYMRAPGGQWEFSVYQDLMIRAHIVYPENLNVDHYKLARYSDFDPVIGPACGTMTMLGDTTTYAYVDDEFQYLPEDWYAYGVQVNYENGDISNWTYSNIIGMNMGRTVEIYLEDCLGFPLDSIYIDMLGKEWPYTSYIDKTDSNGICVFDCVWKGYWEFQIIHPGYNVHVDSILINNDTSLSFAVDPLLFQPRDLQVDSITGEMNWTVPLLLCLEEDFNDNPWQNGWREDTGPLNAWVLAISGTVGDVTIPPWNSQYVYYDDYTAGSGVSGQVNYLISPPQMLRGDFAYYVLFDSFYHDGGGEQLALVEYSFDNGASWEILDTLDPNSEYAWEKVDFDITSIHNIIGNSEFWLGFNTYTPYPCWGGGWAIDNVEIIGDSASPLDYNVYLDSAFITIVDTTFYQFYELTYGQTYNACVSANYECGTSELVCIDFTSGYLRQPDWLHGDTVGDIVMLNWLMDTSDISDKILGYNVFRDSVLITIVSYLGSDSSCYVDTVPTPVCYEYHVSTLYDLSDYGCPGDTGESLRTGPLDICPVFGAEPLTYSQDWSSGSFDPFWTAETDWNISDEEGNPPPCAKFRRNEQIWSFYQKSLSSNYLNGVYDGTVANPYTDGKIILEFDLALEPFYDKSEEHLYIDVWKNGQWFSVKVYDNSNGAFDWQSVNLDITQYAMGTVFKVRFRATGKLSLTNFKWFVDNIEIYHYCPSPENFSAEWWSMDEQILLNWSPVADTGNKFSDNFIPKTVLGYNLYLDQSEDDFVFLDFTEDTFYYYDYSGGTILGFYVTAVYESCESDPSGEAWLYVGLEEINCETALLIFPNPTRESVTIKSGNPINQICIIDYYGHMLFCTELAGQSKTSLDVSAYKPGIYLLQIDTEKGRFVRKIVLSE
jgi:hypothetical protein